MTAARAAAGLAALVFAAPLLAEPAPESEPPVVRRTGPARVETVVPSELPEDPTAFTTVIEVDDFEAEAASVEELLGDAVGVQVRRFGGPGERSEVSIRGSTSSQVVVLLDGVRLNTAQSGTVDLSTVPLSLLDRIEVSRGGGSVQAGSDSIGGVINLVTRRPGAETERRVEGSAGSFSTWQGAAFHRGRVGGTELVAGVDGFTTGGDFEFQRAFETLPGGGSAPRLPNPLERINNRSRRSSSLVRIGRELGDRTQLSFLNHLAYTSRGQPGLDNTSDAVGGQQRDAWERRTRVVSSLLLERSELPLSTIGRARLYHRWERTRFDDPAPQLGGPIDTLNRNGAFGLDLELDGSFRTGWIDHRPRFVGALRRDTLDSNESDDQRRRSLGLAVQDDLSLFGSRLRLVPALRLDDTEGFGAEYLPRIGVAVELLPGLRLLANAERSYRAPNLDELFFPDKGFLRGNPGLLPEEAENLDAGLQLALARLGPLEDVNVELVGFRNEIENSIVFVLVSSGTVAPVNTGDARIEGLEVSLSFGVAGWIRVAANYTDLDAELSSLGTPLPGRADREASVRVELGPPSGVLRLTGELRHTGEIPVSFSGLTALSDRTVYDASIVADLTRFAPRLGLELRSLLLSFGGRNLTDRAVRDAQFFPQPGRSLFLGFQVGF